MGAARTWFLSQSAINLEVGQTIGGANVDKRGIGLAAQQQKISGEWLPAAAHVDHGISLSGNTAAILAAELRPCTSAIDPKRTAIHTASP
jgi:hypothetical protein